MVALPVELNPDQRIRLVRGFSQELSDRIDSPWTSRSTLRATIREAIRAIFMRTCSRRRGEITPSGLTAKTTLELGDAARRQLGLSPAVYELIHVRKRWATVANQALHDAHQAARIDHRTLRAQGIEREPTPWKPRVSYDLQRQEARDAEAGRHKEEIRPSPRRAPDLEEMRRQAREKWLRTRQESSEREASSARGQARDDDLAR